jgi:hypothetical protein
LYQDENGEHTTWGFVQVWLDVVSISSSSLFSFCSGWTLVIQVLVVIFITDFSIGFCAGLDDQ